MNLYILIILRYFVYKVGCTSFLYSHSMTEAQYSKSKLSEAFALKVGIFGS